MTTFALLTLAAFLQSSFDPDMVEAGNYIEFKAVTLELRRTEINTYMRDVDLKIKEICNA